MIVVRHFTKTRLNNVGTGLIGCLFLNDNRQIIYVYSRFEQVQNYLKPTELRVG